MCTARARLVPRPFTTNYVAEASIVNCPVIVCVVVAQNDNHVLIPYVTV